MVSIIHQEIRFVLSFSSLFFGGGINQRDVTTHYPFLQEKRALIEVAIVSFFDEKIKEGFRDIVSSSEMPNYVFDCYVTPRKHRVRLIDFGIWGFHTLPLLFSWYACVAIRIKF